jgi:hypothetical protein
MDRPSLLKKLDETLTEWERTHQWGELWIEVKDGQPTLFKATVQQKLNSYQLGGFPHGRRETR